MTKAGYMPRQSLDATGFDNTFQLLGTLSAAGVIIKIVNNSNVDIDVSTNGGVDEHDFVPAGSFFIYDMRTNRDPEHDFVFPNRTQFTIRGVAAGSGSVFLVGLREIT